MTKRTMSEAQGMRRAAKAMANRVRVEVPIETALELVERAKREPLGDEDAEILVHTIQTLAATQKLLEDKNATLADLRALFFGPKDERSSTVLPKDTNDVPAAPSTPDEQAPKPKRPRPGHGRRCADEYRGASTVHVEHELLRAGYRCPRCIEGTLYSYVPKKFIHFKSGPLIDAECTIVQKLRCGSCQLIISATHPRARRTR